MKIIKFLLLIALSYSRQYLLQSVLFLRLKVKVEYISDIDQVCVSVPHYTCFPSLVNYCVW